MSRFSRRGLLCTALTGVVIVGAVWFRWALIPNWLVARRVRSAIAATTGVENVQRALERRYEILASGLWESPSSPRDWGPVATKVSAEKYIHIFVGGYRVFPVDVSVEAAVLLDGRGRVVHIAVRRTRLTL